jgi:hypothetical protein
MFRPRRPIVRKHTAVPNSCFNIFCMYREIRNKLLQLVFSHT